MRSVFGWIEEAQTINGRRHGIYRFIHQDGSYVIGSFNDGTEVGESYRFDSDGRKQVDLTLI